MTTEKAKQLIEAFTKSGYKLSAAKKNALIAVECYRILNGYDIKDLHLLEEAIEDVEPKRRKKVVA